MTAQWHIDTVLLDFDRLNAATVKTPPPLDSRRLGMITGSGLYPIMQKPKYGDFTGAAETYILSLAVARITGNQPQTFETAAMRLGIEREPEAVQAFINATHYEVDKSGENQVFNIHSSGIIGSTPDGIVTSNPIEVKCPGYANHLQYRAIKNAADLLRIEPKYFWQCATHCLCLSTNFCWFISYNPEGQGDSQKFSLWNVLLEFNQADLDRLLERAELAEAYVRKIVENGEV